MKKENAYSTHEVLGFIFTLIREKAFIREQGRIKEMSPSEIIEMSSNNG